MPRCEHKNVIEGAEITTNKETKALHYLKDGQWYQIISYFLFHKDFKNRRMYKYISPFEIDHDIYAATIVPLPTSTKLGLGLPPLTIVLGKHDVKKVVNDNLILSKDYIGLWNTYDNMKILSLLDAHGNWKKVTSKEQLTKENINIVLLKRQHEMIAIKAWEKEDTEGLCVHEDNVKCYLGKDLVNKKSALFGDRY